MVLQEVMCWVQGLHWLLWYRHGGSRFNTSVFVCGLIKEEQTCKLGNIRGAHRARLFTFVSSLCAKLRQHSIHVDATSDHCAHVAPVLVRGSLTS